jgi:hypothetical protein
MTDFKSRSLRETDNKKAMQAIREWYPNKRITDDSTVMDNLKDDGTYDRVNRQLPTEKEFMERLWNHDD